MNSIGWYEFLWKKNGYRSPGGFAKPAASRLRAEVPWNYIHGRLAAALQSVFETHPAPSRRFFSNVIILDY